MCPAFRKSNSERGGDLRWEPSGFTWHSDALLRFWVSREAERQNCGGGCESQKRALSEEHREEISAPLKTGGR